MALQHTINNYTADTFFYSFDFVSNNSLFDFSTDMPFEGGFVFQIAWHYHFEFAICCQNEISFKSK